jgi:hypothetical protein
MIPMLLIRPYQGSSCSLPNPGFALAFGEPFTPGYYLAAPSELFNLSIVNRKKSWTPTA